MSASTVHGDMTRKYKPCKLCKVTQRWVDSLTEIILSVTRPTMADRTTGTRVPISDPEQTLSHRLFQVMNVFALFSYHNFILFCQVFLFSFFFFLFFFGFVRVASTWFQHQLRPNCIRTENPSNVHTGKQPGSFLYAWIKVSGCFAKLKTLKFHVQRSVISRLLHHSDNLRK